MENLLTYQKLNLPFDDVMQRERMIQKITKLVLQIENIIIFLINKKINEYNQV